MVRLCASGWQSGGLLRGNGVCCSLVNRRIGCCIKVKIFELLFMAELSYFKESLYLFSTHASDVRKCEHIIASLIGRELLHFTSDLKICLVVCLNLIMFFGEIPLSIRF